MLPHGVYAAPFVRWDVKYDFKVFSHVLHYRYLFSQDCRLHVYVRVKEK